MTQILISRKFEKEIVYESSVLAWVRIRIEQKCWIRIRIKSIRIHNPEMNHAIFIICFLKHLPVNLLNCVGT
jgi:hypothetical protein